LYANYLLSFVVTSFKMHLADFLQVIPVNVVNLVTRFYVIQ